MLTIDEIGIQFGGLKAVDGVSFSVKPGEVFALIGPNGAGKTTLLNMISGVYKPSRGIIRLGEEDLTRLAPHQLAARGIARTFQNLQIFTGLSVAENVMTAMHCLSRHFLPSELLGLPASTRRNRAQYEKAVELLARVGMTDHADAASSSLSYGSLKRLEIARALALDPRFVLFDEPAAGCNPSEKATMATLIRQIADEGVGVLLIEHDMKLVMAISNRIHVLDHGKSLAEGTAEEIRHDPKVIEAYLGTQAAAEGYNA